MKELTQIIEHVCSRRDRSWVLASLVATRGSTYRKPGARMLVDESGNTTGVLSGGCLEEEIAGHAKAIIDGAPARVLEFDTRRLYGCDGKVYVLLEPLPPAGTDGNLLTDVGERLNRREHCRLSSCYEGEALGSRILGPEELVAERSGTFLHLVPLPVRLLLLGSGPEIVPLQRLAQTLGWMSFHCMCAADVPEDFRADDQSAALVMTHNFGRDLAALHRVLPLRLPYIGLLGPRKRHQQVIAELLNHSPFHAESLARLHAPAGLDLGSESPEEIALSIVSEVAAVLAGRHGGHLRDRASAIHLVEQVDAKDQAA